MAAHKPDVQLEGSPAASAQEGRLGLNSITLMAASHKLADGPTDGNLSVTPHD
jgi:hypothetical protein